MLVATSSPALPTLPTHAHAVRVWTGLMCFSQAHSAGHCALPFLADEWSKHGAGFLDFELGAVDQAFFRLSRIECRTLDPHQLLMLETVWHALEDAGIDPHALSKRRVGVFIGHASTDFAGLTAAWDVTKTAFSTTSVAASVVANRISYFLDLLGPSIVVDTACSSSLVAVDMAMASIRAGKCELAIVGGVNLLLADAVTESLSVAGFLSSDSKCHSFDASANGYVRGEGCAAVVLRGDTSAARSPREYAQLVSSAVNHGGRSNGLTAPNPLSQESVIMEACANGGVSPAHIAYVEAHGTGTSLGDAIELAALQATYGTSRDSGSKVLLGAVKTNIGHLEACSGIVGLIKTCLCLHHRSVPPSLNYVNPNTHVNWESSNLEVVTKQTALVEGPSGRILAGVTSFGLGGTNAHVILEAVPPPVADHEGKASTDNTPTIPTDPSLLVYSAASPTALMVLQKAYLEAVSNLPRPRAELLARSMCAAACIGRAHLPFRSAHVWTDVDELIAALTPRSPPTSPPKAKNVRVAMMFAGQGSMSVEVAKGLYQCSPAFAQALTECDAIVNALSGRNILDMLFSNDQLNPANRANANSAQIILFSVQYALFKQWEAWGVRPTAVGGHALGEYVAACVSGIWDLHDAIVVVLAREELMHQLPSQEAGMLAVNLSWDAFEARCRHRFAQHINHVHLAARNAPTSIVVSGTLDALDACVADLSQEQIKHKRLAVSHAFHSPLMDPMLDEFREVLESVTFGLPRIEIIACCPTPDNPGASMTSVEHWLNHVVHTVDFVSAVEWLDVHADAVIEVSPTPTLLPMAQMSPTTAAWVSSLRSKTDGPSTDSRDMLAALAAMYRLGFDPAWTTVAKPWDLAPEAWGRLPGYPFDTSASPPSSLKALMESRDQRPRSPPSQQKAAAAKTFETVRQLWSGLLLVDAEDIVEDADFFELGGTSIEAVEFIQQLEAQTRTVITLRDFMQSPTPSHVLGMMLAEEGGGSPGTPPEHHMPRLNALDAVSPFRRTWLLNIGQLLGLVMLVYIWFAPAVLSVRALFWVSDELSLSMYAAVALAPAAWWFVYVLLLLAASTMLQLLLLGRSLRPGEWDVNSSFFLRWWMCQRLNGLVLKMVFGGPVGELGIVHLYLRILGAKLGSNVVLDLGALSDPSLVEIGDDSVLSGGSCLATSAVRGGRLVMDRIVLGRQVAIAKRSVVELGTTVGDGATLSAFSATLPGTVLDPLTEYHGAPAKPAPNQNCLALDPVVVSSNSLNCLSFLGKLAGMYSVLSISAASGAVAYYAAIKTVDICSVYFRCSTKDTQRLR